MEPDDLLCSQNAHDNTVLVRCAQWKINQPASPPLFREQENDQAAHPILQRLRVARAQEIV